MIDKPKTPWNEHATGCSMYEAEGVEPGDCSCGRGYTMNDQIWYLTRRVHALESEMQRIKAFLVLDNERALH